MSTKREKNENSYIRGSIRGSVPCSRCLRTSRLAVNSHPEAKLYKWEAVCNLAHTAYNMKACSSVSVQELDDILRFHNDGSCLNTRGVGYEGGW